MRLLVVLLISFFLIDCTSHKIRTKNVDSDSVRIEENNLITEDSEFYVEIDDEYTGVYLPKKYIDGIIETKNHSLVMHEKDANYHNYLYVQKNVIYSDLKWHDTYAINKNVASKFEYIKEGNNTIIIDDKNNQYIKISNDTSNKNEIIKKYIAKIILIDLINKNIIAIKDGSIEINNKKYEIILDDMFFPKGCNLIIYNIVDNVVLGLKIIDETYVFYRIIPGKEDGQRNVLSDEFVLKYTIN